MKYVFGFFAALLFVLIMLKLLLETLLRGAALADSITSGPPEAAAVFLGLLALAVVAAIWLVIAAGKPSAEYWD